MKTGMLLGALLIAIATVGCVDARSEDELADEAELSEPLQETTTLTGRADHTSVLDQGDWTNVALKQCSMWGTCANGTPYQAALGAGNTCPSYARSYANSLCGGAVRTFTCVCQ